MLILISHFTTDSTFSGILAGVLGGGITGVLLILLIITLILLLAIRAYRKKIISHVHIEPQLQEANEKSAYVVVQGDHGFELKDNEAYSSITHYIPIDENGAYAGQTVLQISTKDNVAYGQRARGLHD